MLYPIATQHELYLILPMQNSKTGKYRFTRLNKISVKTINILTMNTETLSKNQMNLLTITLLHYYLPRKYNTLNSSELSSLKSAYDAKIC